MAPHRQESTSKRTGGARSGSVMNFRTTVSPGSVRRSAVLPSVLTFLVIVASGGLLLMIEKGMLNGVETPPPRVNGKRLDFIRQAATQSRAAVDVESQVQYPVLPCSLMYWTVKEQQSEDQKPTISFFRALVHFFSRASPQANLSDTFRQRTAALSETLLSAVIQSQFYLSRVVELKGDLMFS